MDSDSDGEEVCPLCCNELDATDLNFLPCPCGYQVCLYCYGRLEKEFQSRCPACRNVYGEGEYKITNPADLMKYVKNYTKELKARKSSRDKRRSDRERRKAHEAAETKRQQQRLYASMQSKQGGDDGNNLLSSDGSASASSIRHVPDPVPLTPQQRRELTDTRVIQRNLVYVIGLAPKIAKEDTLRSHEYFGQYGQIVKVVVNRSHIKQNTHNSASAYITYKRQDSAKEAIAAIHGFVWDERTIKASFGTTKYCNMFLKGMKCTNGECLYLHYLGDESDSFTKEQMLQSSKQQFLDQTQLGDDIDSKMSLDNRPTVFPKPKYVLDRIEKAKEDAAKRVANSDNMHHSGGVLASSSAAVSMAGTSRRQHGQQQQPVPLMSTGPIHPAMHPPSLNGVGGNILLGGGADNRDPNGILSGVLHGLGGGLPKKPPSMNSQNFPSLGGKAKRSTVPPSSSSLPSASSFPKTPADARVTTSSTQSTRNNNNSSSSSNNNNNNNYNGHAVPQRSMRAGVGAVRHSHPNASGSSGSDNLLNAGTFGGGVSIGGVQIGGLNQHGRLTQNGLNQGRLNQGRLNQGGLNQGGLNQGGLNHGGLNHGGLNQGGFGFNQGGIRPLVGGLSNGGIGGLADLLGGTGLGGPSHLGGMHHQLGGLHGGDLNLNGGGGGLNRGRPNGSRLNGGLNNGMIGSGGSNHSGNNVLLGGGPPNSMQHHGSLVGSGSAMLGGQVYGVQQQQHQQQQRGSVDVGGIGVGVGSRDIRSTGGNIGFIQQRQQQQKTPNEEVLQIPRYNYGFQQLQPRLAGNGGGVIQLQGPLHNNSGRQQRGGETLLIQSSRSVGGGAGVGGRGVNTGGNIGMNNNDGLGGPPRMMMPPTNMYGNQQQPHQQQTSHQLKQQPQHLQQPQQPQQQPQHPQHPQQQQQSQQFGNNLMSMGAPPLLNTLNAGSLMRSDTSANGPRVGGKSSIGIGSGTQQQQHPRLPQSQPKQPNQHPQQVQHMHQAQQGGQQRGSNNRSVISGQVRINGNGGSGSSENGVVVPKAMTGSGGNINVSSNTGRIGSGSSSLMRGGAIDRQKHPQTTTTQQQDSRVAKLTEKKAQQQKNRQSAVDLARQQAEQRRQQHLKQKEKMNQSGGSSAPTTNTLSSSKVTPPTSPGSKPPLRSGRGHPRGGVNSGSTFPRGRRGNRRELQVQQARAAAAAKAAKKAASLAAANVNNIESNNVGGSKPNDAYAAGRLAAARAKARHTPVNSNATAQQPAAVSMRAGGRGPVQRGRSARGARAVPGGKSTPPLLMPSASVHQPPLLTASENGGGKVESEGNSKAGNSNKSRRKRPRGKKNRPKQSSS